MQIRERATRTVQSNFTGQASFNMFKGFVQVIDKKTNKECIDMLIETVLIGLQSGNVNKRTDFTRMSLEAGNAIIAKLNINKDTDTFKQGSNPAEQVSIFTDGTKNEDGTFKQVSISQSKVHGLTIYAGTPQAKTFSPECELRVMQEVKAGIENVKYTSVKHNDTRTKGEFVTKKGIRCIVDSVDSNIKCPLFVETTILWTDAKDAKGELMSDKGTLDALEAYNAYETKHNTGFSWSYDENVYMCPLKLKAYYTSKTIVCPNLDRAIKEVYNNQSPIVSNVVTGANVVRPATVPETLWNTLNDAQKAAMAQG